MTIYCTEFFKYIYLSFGFTVRKKHLDYICFLTATRSIQRNTRPSHCKYIYCLLYQISQIKHPAYMSQWDVLSKVTRYLLTLSWNVLNQLCPMDAILFSNILYSLRCTKVTLNLFNGALYFLYLDILYKKVFTYLYRKTNSLEDTLILICVKCNVWKTRKKETRSVIFLSTLSFCLWYVNFDKVYERDAIFCIECPARSANVEEDIRWHLRKLKVVSISRKMSKMHIQGGW